MRLGPVGECASKQVPPRVSGPMTRLMDFPSPRRAVWTQRAPRWGQQGSAVAMRE